MAELGDEGPDGRVGPIPRRLVLRGVEARTAGINCDELDVRSLEDMMKPLGPRQGLRRALVHAFQGRIDELRLRVRMQGQRRRRGWADQDWWILNQHLCSHLGQLMVALVSEGRTLPAWVEDDGDGWRGEVRRHAEALLAFDMTDRRTTAAAAASLHWVADNLEDLWD